MDDCSDDEDPSLNLLEDQAVAYIVVVAAAGTVDVDIVVNVVDVVAAVDYFFVVCFFAVNMDAVSGAAVAY